LSYRPGPDAGVLEESVWLWKIYDYYYFILYYYFIIIFIYGARNPLWHRVVVPARAMDGVLEESMEARNPLWHKVVVPAPACAGILEQFMGGRN
jgi:hypothetical protein